MNINSKKVYPILFDNFQRGSKNQKDFFNFKISYNRNKFQNFWIFKNIWQSETNHVYFINIILLNNLKTLYYYCFGGTHTCSRIWSTLYEYIHTFSKVKYCKAITNMFQLFRVYSKYWSWKSPLITRKLYKDIAKDNLSKIWWIYHYSKQWHC